MKNTETFTHILILLDADGCDWPERLIAAHGSTLTCTDGHNIREDVALAGQPAVVTIRGEPATIHDGAVHITAYREDGSGFCHDVVGQRPSGVQAHVFEPDEEGDAEITIDGETLRGHLDTHWWM